jgi:hypothetical protein
MNPAWQDLAEGWGEQTKRQIPRFARDDNPENDNPGNMKDNSRVEETNTGATEVIPLQSKAKTA